MNNIIVRHETRWDAHQIRSITADLIKSAAHEDFQLPAEHLTIDLLRNERDLTLSLVAEYQRFIVGHVALAPIAIEHDASSGPARPSWYGFSPLVVLPEFRQDGVGAELIETGLDLLRHRGAAGCVALGSIDYYRRFGFAPAALRIGKIPPGYIVARCFDGPSPSGTVVDRSVFCV
ncbi:GNAT family N-acetyltransferase [Burkholderia alba]|uniref:GNAT family N-acetyltransferase n=1 Tax=Burkholderia alba TaxID=2683677 RepID=UPI002B05BE55|nr:N-acetyltransferase [Burkholderia alba]